MERKGDFQIIQFHFCLSESLYYITTFRDVSFSVLKVVVLCSSFFWEAVTKPSCTENWKPYRHASIFHFLLFHPGPHYLFWQIALPSAFTQPVPAQLSFCKAKQAVLLPAVLLLEGCPLHCPTWTSLLWLVPAWPATSGTAESPKDQVNNPDYRKFMAVVAFLKCVCACKWAYVSYHWGNCKYKIILIARLAFRIGPGLTVDVWLQGTITKKKKTFTIVVIPMRLFDEVIPSTFSRWKVFSEGKHSKWWQNQRSSTCVCLGLTVQYTMWHSQMKRRSLLQWGNCNYKIFPSWLLDIVWYP